MTYGNNLHPPLQALRTALMAAACGIALLTPIVWALQQIGALP